MLFACCCNDCTIWSDNFNRADSGSLGASWTEEAGAWEIAANKLKCTSANALARPLPGIIGLDDYFNWSVKLLGANSGDQLGCGFGDSFLGVRLTVGSPAYLELMLSQNGTDYVRRQTVTAAAAVEHTIAARWDKDGLGTDILLNDVVVFNFNATPPGNITPQLTWWNDSLSTGLRLFTGNIASHVTFDDFQLIRGDYYSAGCPGGANGPNLPFKARNAARITLSGYTDNGAYLWSNLNGSYDLTYSQIDYPAGSNPGGGLAVNIPINGSDKVTKLFFAMTGDPSDYTGGRVDLLSNFTQYTGFNGHSLYCTPQNDTRQSGSMDGIASMTAVPQPWTGAPAYIGQAVITAP